MNEHSASTASATPLLSLSAVVLDTETTGLDTTAARIIQIGAVHIDSGRLSDATFEQFVDPGLPIPPESTRIHHIEDADVVGASGFATVYDAYRAWAGGRVLIGYSIGFDLAMFKAEHQRLGTAWQAPRSLDVRHLAQLVSPQLPDMALDTVAHWLGIEVTDRHRALGDALVTAKVFLALVPLLRKKGILTLAEVENACGKLTQQKATESEAGWIEVVRSAEITPDSVTALARVDSYPYRHRVRDVMNAPAKVIPADMTVRDVLALLMRDHVSSVFVLPGAKGGVPGIITERDILRAINAKETGALALTADELAIRPLKTIGEDEYVYRAIGRMNTGGFRHLGVSGADGTLTGALSARDLLRQRAGDAISLDDEIERAESPEELGLIWTKLTLVARGLAYEEVDPRDIATIISRELRALTRQACRIAESEMEAQGKGGPPVPYAMLVLGSGGRGESLLAMDQDNAIIFATGEPGGPEDLWFEALGKRVADILDMVGVQYCKGGIMASNAEWRMSVKNWRTMVAGWIHRSRPKDILNTDIFFDCAPVHGATELGDKLRVDALDVAAQSSNFLHLMSQNAADVHPPLGWFGRFRLEDGRMDLKKGGIMPIFSSARVLALKHRIEARATPERLETARSLLDEERHLITPLIDAHRVLLGAILKQQLLDLEQGTALSNSVSPKEFSASERDSLKWAVEQIRAVPNLLGDPVLLS